MTLYPEQLRQHLEKNGLPAVLRIFGDEPLLLDDCVLVVRDIARQQGIDERERLIQDNSFNWSQLTDSSQSLSLFSSTRLVELEMPEGKPGRDGAEQLKRYAEHPSPDQCLVLLGPKLKKDQLKAKWFTAFDNLGPLVQANSPDRSRLPIFIHKRAQSHQLKLADDAVQILADWYEGNLIALDQQLAKLSLLDLPQPITVATIREHSEDSSRFQIFSLQESLLQGQQDQALHRLQRLLSDAVEPAILSWLLQREWQQLWTLTQALKAGEAFAPACQKIGIWPSQQAQYKSWLERLTEAKLIQISHLLRRYELAFKRDSGEDLTTLAVHLVLAFCAQQSIPDIGA